MEDLGLQALHWCVAGIDVHRMRHVVTVLRELPDGSMKRQTREFGGFRRDFRALAEWLKVLWVKFVVMESAGNWWKSGIEMPVVLPGDADCGEKGASGVGVTCKRLAAGRRVGRRRAGPAQSTGIGEGRFWRASQSPTL